MDRTNRNLWIGLGIVALLWLVASSWGGGMMFDRGVVGPFGVRPFLGAPWLAGIWGLALLIRVLVIGGLIFLVVRLFRGRTTYDHHVSHLGMTPEEILRRRYAAGDISREQYEEMRRTLEPTSV
jgi:putative membrane protein